MYSDKQLALEGVWFTGEEWANGTAQKYLTKQFHEAEATLKKAGVKPESNKETRYWMGFPKSLDELRTTGYKHTGLANCRACGEAIEWWETPKAKRIPMNHGTAVPHWSTCPNADDFRKPKVGRSTFEANRE